MYLNCHTYYSFCYGTLSPQDLVSSFERLGQNKFVLTDINSTSGCIETYRLAKEQGISVAMGVDFRNGNKQEYVAVAKNNAGFFEINNHLSFHLHNKLPFNLYAPAFENVYVIYPFKKYKLIKLRSNEYFGVSINDLLRLVTIPINQDKIVVLQPITYIEKRFYNAHRLLRAIDTNNLLSKLPLTEHCSIYDTFPENQQIKHLQLKYSKIFQNTFRILDECKFEIEFSKYSDKNLRHYSASKQEDILLLRSLCEQGIEYRFGVPSETVLLRIEKELKIIQEMNFAAYFLINKDIVDYARHKGYFYIGRGSGANSMVAYLLSITEVDPIELDLYFERFINPARSNPPDFDIDFSWTDRDDITRYIFERFGSNRTALLGTYNTFQSDAIIRELGKVFGLPPTEIDNLQSQHKISIPDSQAELILKYAALLKGFPSHLGIHASGIIISQEPIHNYTATYLPPKGYPTTQFSMQEAEDIGLYKFDILSQRGLGKIKDTVTLVKENQGIDVDIHKVREFKNDEKVKSLIKQGNTIGCFYVESPAMRMLLIKLKADDYLRLVAASSIIRPGVAKSGMMREYILRFRNPELRTKARERLPQLYDILHETFGVMVYQEDVIKVAHLFAGLSLTEADYLRRGMSWKFKKRNEFNQIKQKFFDNCNEKNYPSNIIEEVWQQIESFANFAFSKGHSASYAVESYQALYLKAYYPIEYLVATINNGGGFYRTELYVHEAKIHGALVHPPCINNSDAKSVVKKNEVYLGLNLILSIEQNTIIQMLDERLKNGVFLSLENFIKRVNLSMEQVTLLIRCGAFQFTGVSKKELLWKLYMLNNPNKINKNQNELFAVEAKKWKLPELVNLATDDAFDELELLGFPLCNPFLLLQNIPEITVTAKDLKNHINQTLTILGYLITKKYAITSKGEKMYFGTFIDYNGRWIDTVHFPPSLKLSSFTGPGCYEITGKVINEYDFISIEVNTMKRLSIIDREK